jgi:ferric-dicitrate binding protein FerR (iron transport regulator)
VTEDFEAELAADERFERRLFWRQLAIVILVAAVIVLLIVVG